MTSLTKPIVLEALYKFIAEMDIDPRIELSLATMPALTLESLRVDSLDLLELAMNVENELGVQFEIDTLPPTTSIDELADIISRSEKASA
jgi:acyl carrier protein